MPRERNSRRSAVEDFAWTPVGTISMFEDIVESLGERRTCSVRAMRIRLAGIRHRVSLEESRIKRS